MTSFLNTLDTGFIALLLGVSKEEYMPIDLSVSNTKLSLSILQNAQLHEQWITTGLRQNGKRIAYGGYLEKRKLYERSTHFQSVDTAQQRNIHLGVDLWCNAVLRYYVR